MRKLKDIYIILENIRSLYNVGAIFRTAEATARVKKIYLCGITGTPDQKGFLKTALSGAGQINWEYWPNTRDLIKKLKSKKVKIIALEQTEESFDYKKFQPKFPLALILGNEKEGVDPEILKMCDQKIQIPLFGKGKSLNVAVAFGIVIYEIIS